MLEFYITRSREASDGSDFTARYSIGDHSAPSWNKTVDDIVTGNESSCFVVDAATEMADHDEEVARLIRGQCAWSEETFRQLFAEAQRNGEIRPERDPKALARFFVNVFQGMRVTGKVNRDRQAICRILSIRQWKRCPDFLAPILE